MNACQKDSRLDWPYTASDAASQQSARGSALLVFTLTKLGVDVNKTSSVHPTDLLGFGRLAIDGTGVDPSRFLPSVLPGVGP